MPEQNFILEVRAAKAWLDEQSPTFRELGLRLAAVEQAYRSRTAEFSRLPKERPESVLKAIDAAQDEPGRGLLDDVRPSRST
jgi:hypothetical protein